MRLKLKTLLAVCGLVLFSASCGTGFVNGWGDDDDPSHRELCDQRGESWVWLNGQCQKSEGLDLTQIEDEAVCENVEEAIWLTDRCYRYNELAEGQCVGIDGLVWYSQRCMSSSEQTCLEAGEKIYLQGQCHDQPVIEIQSHRQSVATGAAMRPVTILHSEGSSLEIVSQSCPSFFHISESNLASRNVTNETGSCTADVVAKLGEASSEAARYEVVLAQSFLEYCRNPTSEAVRTTVRILHNMIEGGNNCKDAFAKLREVEAIHWEGVTGARMIVDLSPLRGLPKLKSLRLGYNAIVDVEPLSALPALEYLDLGFNKIENVAVLRTHPTLKTLYLEGNPVLEDLSNQTCPTGAGVNMAVSRVCRSLPQ